MRIINPLINPIKWQTSYTTGDSFKSCLDRGLSDHVEQLVERSIWRIDQVLVGLLATILGWWTPYWVKRVLFVALYKNALCIYIYIRIKMRVELFAMIRHFAAPLKPRQLLSSEIDWNIYFKKSLNMVWSHHYVLRKPLGIWGRLTLRHWDWYKSTLIWEFEGPWGSTFWSLIQGSGCIDSDVVNAIKKHNQFHHLGEFS